MREAGVGSLRTTHPTADLKPQPVLQCDPPSCVFFQLQDPPPHGQGVHVVSRVPWFQGDVYQLAWSADSRLLVSVSKDSTAKCWDIARRKLLEDLPGHADEA